MKLIIDTDPGVDDTIAILMALAAREVEVVGLTTVGGNVPRARATRNSLALLQAAGRSDIPVARGAARPRSGRFQPSVVFHGPGGLSVRLPEPRQAPVQETAVDFLRSGLTLEPGEVVLVALGPLTNLSQLERRDPGTLSLAARVVVMGGAVEAPGNVSQRAEFNFHSDPVAAAHVLGLGIPVTLADLAACRQVGIDRDQAPDISAHSMLGELALRVLQGWFYRDPQRQRFEFYDPLAMALAIDPSVATLRQISLNVGAEPGEHWGESTVIGEPGPVSLAHRVDATRVLALVSELFDWRAFRSAVVLDSGASLDPACLKFALFRSNQYVR